MAVKKEKERENGGPAGVGGPAGADAGTRTVKGRDG